MFLLYHTLNILKSLNFPKQKIAIE